jgi:hypothetical protein
MGGLPEELLMMPLFIPGRLITKKFLGLLLLVSIDAAADFNHDRSCITEAYPDFHLSITEEGNIRVNDGTVLIFDKKVDASSHEFLLENSDLKSQFSQRYSIDRLDAPPSIDWDPGRLRSEELFQKIYGSSEKIVKANLEKVWWEPCKCYVPFSRAEGAASALKRAGEALSLLPYASQYVGRPNGTMSWRKISGSSRLSMHAFGVAIDFSLPLGLQAYWRWSGCAKKKICPYPANVLKDDQLAKIVQVFEHHGFIWGGKWYHFDTIHFEYRPELLNPKCGANHK